jgi:hypothetical protein
MITAEAFLLNTCTTVGGHLIMRNFILVTFAAIVIFSGCARTKIVKKPCPDDTGVRFYRPKQYLMIGPGTLPGHVTISVTQLPDYNEEYSIHVNAGLGTNSTDITLEGGWNLTGVKINVDSKAAELITAGSGAIGNIAGLADQSRMENIPTAHDVPLGLYEAVVGCDDNGCKQLYGWRYVGFLPFGGCPTYGEGGPLPHYCSPEIFGIVWTGGKLTVKKLAEIRDNPPSDNPQPAPQGAQVKGEEGDDDGSSDVSNLVPFNY